MTRGAIAEQPVIARRLAELHGDLDAIAIIQDVITLPMLGSVFRPGVVVSDPAWGLTFEAKKHLWNMLSRLTSRVETRIISDRDLLREVIHLSAKGRNRND